MRVIVGKGISHFSPPFAASNTLVADLTLIPSRIGNHSQSHVAKIAPAIEELMVRQNLTAYLDPNNSGVLIVQLNGQGGKGSREVVQDLERQGGTGCLVM